MARTIPSVEPDVLVAGDSWQWNRSLPDYPATTWTLEYHFGGPSEFTVTASADGDQHQVREVPASTAKTPGTYSVAATVSDGTDRFTILEWVVRIRSNLETADVSISHSETMVTLIKASLERLAGNEIHYAQINGRAYQKRDIHELHALLGKYMARVRRERNGGRLGTGVGVRFGAPL